MKQFLIITSFIAFSIISAKAELKKMTEGKYTYEFTDNDPLKARIYTLENGLKVYMTVFKDEPRVQTFIAVRAGSKNDPPDCTGLAHYLEHMVFKGTDRIACLDWEKEKPLLKQISDLFEQHKNTTDTAKRRALYLEIDRISKAASKYAVPNEYDKMISNIGAKFTNAYTSLERTVYMNDIPSTELEKWMKVESERFQKLVLRIFHTELEAVYEEFNRGQDNDFSKEYHELYKGLFKKHTYGTQTTIGKGEHLKNPSMVKIHEYFDANYLPNNVAICLSGDIDPAKTIELVDKYFGQWKPGKVPEFTYEKEDPITDLSVKKIYGSQEERISIGFRFGGRHTDDALKLEIMDWLLSNGQAGLMDLNLNQKQKVLTAGTFYQIHKDYSTHIFRGTPREGQTLEEVKSLMLGEIEKIKNGDFEDWLIEAVNTNIKLRQTKRFESNWRAHTFVDAFIEDVPWDKHIHRLDALDKITKQDIIAFAKEKYNNNYVEIHKLVGEDKSLHKVVKPLITPIELNREAQSEFYKEFMNMPSKKLEPVFIDYEKDIASTNLASGIKIYNVKNVINETFNLSYILDMGKKHDKKLALAIEYLPYLGTDKYTANQMQQEFFKLGLRFSVKTSNDKAYVSLSGLESSFEKGLELFEHFLSNVKPDPKAYTDLVDGLLKTRADEKLDKWTILWTALYNYGKYGPNSPHTNILSAEELKKITSKQLTDIIKNITTYKHKCFYYGTKDINKVVASINKFHKTPETLKDYPKPTEFEEKETTEKKVYFVHYDMVQAEVIMLAKSEPYHKEWEPYISLYNQYYGSGLSSIVFQEIRESKALAYSAFAGFFNPSEADKAHYIFAYIGTQVDKLPTAIAAFDSLMQDMPTANTQFETSKNSIKSKLETERITKTNIFWNYESAKKKGLDYDIRKDIYEKMQNITMEELKQFHDDHVKPKPYIYLVMGSRDKVDMDYLNSLGKVTELNLEEIFGY